MIAFLPHLLLLLLLSPLASSSATPQPNHGGFSVELIHTDSPKSPFYDPSKTPSQRLLDSVTSSITRINTFKPAKTTPNSPEATITKNRAEYLMKFSLGTPPRDIFGAIDTCHSLTWTQCEPCSKCYTQKDPIFNPNSSSTYRQVPCNSTQCKSLPARLFCDNNKVCYYFLYDGTNGDLAMDTLTLGSTTGEALSLQDTYWGCGHESYGYFNGNGSGIVGLGAGPASLLMQKGAELGGAKFSYCLATTEQGASTLSFGNAGLVSGPEVVSTPLIIKGPYYYYQITLQAISVGNKRFEVQKKVEPEGNMIIDPGNAITYVPPELYYPVKSAVQEAIGLQLAPPTVGLAPCFFNTSYFEAPIITVHLNGADLQLSTLNTFVQATENITCFTFRSDPDYPVLGNIAQKNFLIGYDLEGKTLSFKRAECGK